MTRALALLGVLGAAGCAGDPPPGPVCDRPLIYQRSPGAALEGTGWHRLYVQGATAMADVDGRYGMAERRTAVASGDHFLLSVGAFVEWTYPVAAPLSGQVFAHMARVDDPAVVARYELFLVSGAETIELFSADDTEPGTMGYVPYERCFEVPPTGTPALDTHLLLRATNLTGGMLGIVIRAPDYFTWVDLAVR